MATTKKTGSAAPSKATRKGQPAPSQKNFRGKSAKNKTPGEVYGKRK
jgi:hypothetical protein